MGKQRDLSAALPQHHVEKLIKSWLAEDSPDFDFGGFIVGNVQETAHLFIKSPGTLAGVPFFNAVFKELGCSVDWLITEGSQLTPLSKQKIASVHGPCNNILLGERIALNCLARASGIATVCQKYTQLVQSVAWKGKVAGTRKTTPGFRMVEKYALLVGGADPHRQNLSSMVMLKDNHIQSSGSISKAVNDVRSTAGFSVKIEVECSSLEEALEAGEAGANVVMFDNFEDTQSLHAAAEKVKHRFPEVTVEASGGIDEENILGYCGPNIDIISTSKLVQGYPVVDFSLKILKDQEFLG